LPLACGDDGDDDGGSAGKSGSSGSAGKAGASGSAGKAGGAGKGGGGAGGSSAGRGGGGAGGGESGSNAGGEPGSSGEGGATAGQAGESGVAGAAGDTASGAAAGQAGQGGEGGGSGALPDGLLGPSAYLRRADSPFDGLDFATYSHFEDWEDGVLSPPGVTPSSTTLSTSFGAAAVDSVDGDDDLLDDACAECEAAFANGSIEFTFDAGTLGALPTHVGIVWTDGGLGSDAGFTAYDADAMPIGTLTAPAVGDGNNTGSTAEDRFFGVVHAPGVSRIVVTSSGGGVEVDHLFYAR
jgi:hypothetical protein